MKDIIWTPSKDVVRDANVTRFMKKHGLKTYEELHAWSVADISRFWDAAMKDLGVEWSQPYSKVVDASKGIQWAKWFVGGKLNIVHNCIDRRAKSQPDALAVIWEGEDGAQRKVTYAELNRDVCRLANALKSLGLKKGDTAGIYMPMTYEIVVAFYAALKLGLIIIPIFSGFGAASVASRLANAEAKVLFTADGSLRRGKPVAIKEEADKALADVPSCEHVIVLRRLGATARDCRASAPLAVESQKAGGAPALQNQHFQIPWTNGRDLWFHEIVAKQPDTCATEQLDSEDFAMILYTSGTTGKPKGAVHTHGGALAQIAKELGYAFDVKPSDRFFWVTDIGWMMGPWMLIGVHCHGGSTLIFEGAPNYPQPDRLWDMIERHRITHLGISPTAIRVLMRHGDEWVTKHDLTSLRILGSTGEPWDPDSYGWFFEKIGGKRIPIINISGGTEIVGCFLSPLPITPLKSCSLRGPGLGMDVDVFDENAKPVRGQMGHLVCKQPAPSMTRGFWKDPQRYLETYWSRWQNVWFHGDWALVDEDGFWSLHGRSDDVIKVSGRRTGPAEIEAALIEHPAVSEAAAIGVPDEIKGEDVVCFVLLKPSHKPSEPLRNELKEQVAKILGKTLRPKDLRFVTELPKTRSAKIVRRAIRAAYLGEDLGDLSSVENPAAIDGIKRAA